jgi:hypothetical protein
MTKAIPTSLAVAFIVACGPSVDDEPHPLGHLEYEYGPWAAPNVGWEAGEWYRSERRIELLPEKNPFLTHTCAILTEEAYDQLESTIAALDPSVDYELAHGDCGWSDSPAHRVHLEGFIHSPFWCDWVCCRDELAWIPTTYFLAANELSEDPIEIPGQQYPIVDVDEPCD